MAKTRKRIYKAAAGKTKATKIKEEEAQAEVGYLVTYGWALLILSIVIGGLYFLGVFNFNNYTPASLCTFSSDFSCAIKTLSTTGNVVANIQQATAGPITITATGCNSNKSAVNMQPVAISLQIGGNASINMQCYTGGVPFSGSLGTTFRGYIIINYTDVNTGFPRTITAPVVIAANLQTTTTSVSTTTTTISTTTSTIVYLVHCDVCTYRNQEFQWDCTDLKLPPPSCSSGLDQCNDPANSLVSNQVYTAYCRT